MKLYADSALVALACEDTFYVLRFSRDAYDAALSAGEVEDDGVEAAFEVVCDQNESCTSGTWVGDTFLYTTSTHRLSYLVGDKTYPVAPFDQAMYLLGYLARDGRVYLCDRDLNVISYQLSLSVVEFQTLVLRDELEAALGMLPDIPTEQKAKIARFLEDMGYKEEALDISTDAEHRFDLALSLGKLDIALELAKLRDEEHKWRVVGDAALSAFDAKLAEECFWNAKDLGSLLLLYSATSDREGLRKLANRAAEASAFNVQFECLWLLADVPGCVDLLRSTGRDAEAVMFAKTYKPSLVPGAVKGWKETLEKNGKGRVSRTIGVPPGTDGLEADEDLFPEWEEWLTLEREGGTAKLVDVDAAGDDEGVADSQAAAVAAGDVDVEDGEEDGAEAEEAEEEEED